jgi:hypothetical protein
MTEEFQNNVASQLGAYHYLIGFLLRYSFRELDADGIDAVAHMLKEKIRIVPDSVTGNFAGNDTAAAAYADVIVRMYQHVDAIVDEAVRAVKPVVSQIQQ